jgi:hypothetical protein
VVTITDLDSSNGTRIDGCSVIGPTRVSTGACLRLGGVEGWLEEVADGDLEVGVAAASVARSEIEDRTESQGARATVGPAALERFAFHHLPRLVDGLARGVPSDEFVQTAGHALHDSLPVCRVEVLRDRGPESAVLFTARRDRSTDGVKVAVTTDQGLRLEVDFLTPGLADAFSPLVETTASLLDVALARVMPRGTGGQPSVPKIVEPPSPPSVVAEMQSIYGQANRVASSKVSVLILGESGTGKELLARYLHAASDRADRPLVTLNCAALPRDLLESELFGIEQGVATGVEARPGRFEAAHGGTLFLDEIGDMAADTQARILRVLQEGEVYRVGGHRSRPADVRVISATNRDLEALLADGRFRSDLYHRIADWVVELPPLCRRRGDIPNLAIHFLSRTCDERGVRVTGISRAALDALIAYPWPGNVRELEREMGRAALFLDNGDLLDSSRLQPRIASWADSPPVDSLKEILEKAERDHIQRVLDDCGGLVADAAERLEMGVSTLYRRMKTLGLE